MNGTTEKMNGINRSTIMYSSEIPQEISVKDLLRFSPHYFGQKVFGYRMDNVHTKILDHIITPKRSLALIARGHGKSLMVSVFLTWLIVNNPNIRVLLVSQTDRKSQMFLSKIKTIIQTSPTIKKYYGDLVGSKWTDHGITLKTRTEIYAEPNILAMGANSSQVVGMHVDLIVLDDVVDYDNARSEIQRTRLSDWFKTALLPTILSGGRIVAVGTRYSILDLYDTMMRMDYNVLILPAIGNDGKALCEFLVPLKDKIGKDGEVLVEGLETIKKNLGSVIFNLQYQNNTDLLKEGAIIKYDDLRFYSKTILEDGYTYVIKDEKRIKIVTTTIGVDPAISKQEYADYTAMITAGKDKDGNIYILDIVNAHLSFSEQINKVEYLVEKYHPMETAIEKVGYQEALIQELQRKGGLKIRAVTPTRDKVARLMSVTGFFESGIVHIRNDMNSFIDQLVLFPDGSNDDMVDAMVYALMGLRRTSSGIIRLEF